VTVKETPSKSGPRRRRPLLAAVLVATALLLVLAAPAAAQTFTVTTLTDENVVAGDGSLRGEVRAANAAPGADTIVFKPGLTGAILLQGSGIVVEESLTIEGPGMNLLTVSQNGVDRRVFQIKPSAPAATTLSGLTIQGGTTSGSGGSIQNVLGQRSELTLIGCRVVGGFAGELGGGIDSIGEPLTLRDSDIEFNEAAHDGGAIWVGGNAPTRIEGTTFAQNIVVEGGGGAIYGGGEAGGSTTITGSLFLENKAPEAGGGISWTTAAGSTLAISNSTFLGNTTGTWGGGISLSTSGTTTIEDSTITGNTAEANFEGAGGIEEFAAKKALLRDTIVAGNKSLFTKTPDLKGEYEAAFDLIGNANGALLTELTPGSNLVGVDPGLQPLADNGGPVETMALTAASPAVNKGSGPLTTDGRGDPRPSLYPGVPLSAFPGANGADIGAYELQAPAVLPPPPPPAPLAPAKPRDPRVRLACPKSAGKGGCAFRLQVVAAKPKRVKGKLRQPTAESAVAKLKLAAGKSGLLTLKPKAKYATRLRAARSLLVRQAEKLAGKSHTTYRRLKVSG
jgi:hypothetical protein